MASCNAGCNPGACGVAGKSVVLLKKLDTMISDHYTLLFVLVVVLGILGFALSYFIKSIKETLQAYYRGKEEDKPPAGDNPRVAFDDDYTYYDDVKDDPVKVDPKTNMDEGKQKFFEGVEKAYDEYNTLKTDYIKNTYRGRDNDDTIDRSMLFAGYDAYRYDTDDNEEY